jgi:hypothetical protein
MKKLLKTGLGKSRGPRPASRRRPLRLAVERLEERTVPALVFSPLLGEESFLKDNGAREGGNPVFFIFSGNSWGGSADSPKAQKILNAAKKLLDSPYLSGVEQYDSFGGAHFGGAIFTSKALQGGFSEGNFDDVVHDAFENRGLPEPDDFQDPAPSPIYVVVTDPGIRNKPDDNGVTAVGYNMRGFGDPLDLDWANEIWANGDSPDSFSHTFSHELAETMTDVDSGGYEVLPGPNWTGSTDNADQIGDYEGSNYAYRMNNGVLAQPYWSSDDHGWLGPDGNGPTPFTQKLVVTIDSYKQSSSYTLTINGDQGGANQSDSLSISTNSNGNLVVNLNGEPQLLDIKRRFQGQTFGTLKLAAVNINLGGGANSIDVSAPLTIPIVINVDHGSTLKVSGLAAGDTLQINCPNDFFTPAPVIDIGSLGIQSNILGTINLSGQNLTVTVDDSNNSADAHKAILTGNVDGSTSLGWVGLGSISFGTTTTSTLHINCGIHDSVEVVNQLSGANRLFLKDPRSVTLGGFGNSNDQGLTIQSFGAQCYVTARKHTNPLILLDTNPLILLAIEPTLQLPMINFLASPNSGVTVDDSSPLANLTVKANGGSVLVVSHFIGDRTLEIDATGLQTTGVTFQNLDDLWGRVSVNGNGHTILYVDDSARAPNPANPTTYVVTAASVSSRRSLPVNFSGLTGLYLWGVRGSTYDIEDTGTQTTHLYPDSSSVVVKGIGGELVVTGRARSGTSSVALGDGTVNKILGPVRLFSDVAGKLDLTVNNGSDDWANPALHNPALPHDVTIDNFGIRGLTPGGVFFYQFDPRELIIKGGSHVSYVVQETGAQTDQIFLDNANAIITGEYPGADSPG